MLINFENECFEKEDRLVILGKRLNFVFGTKEEIKPKVRTIDIHAARTMFQPIEHTVSVETNGYGVLEGKEDGIYNFAKGDGSMTIKFNE